jgi:hypothetical protein
MAANFPCCRPDARPIYRQKRALNHGQGRKQGRLTFTINWPVFEVTEVLKFNTNLPTTLTAGRKGKA